MGLLPYYTLVGIGVGLVIILYLYDLRLALDYLLTLVKVLVIMTGLLFIGGVVGWWDLPRPMGPVVFRLNRLWVPFQQNLMAWIRSLLS